eukprot:COSAG06_NODE_673_length_13189_cov_211.299312_10_plen_146_part_00
MATTTIVAIRRRPRGLRPPGCQSARALRPPRGPAVVPASPTWSRCVRVAAQTEIPVLVGARLAAHLPVCPLRCLVQAGARALSNMPMTVRVEKATIRHLRMAASSVHTPPLASSLWQYHVASCLQTLTLPRRLAAINWAAQRKTR